MSAQKETELKTLLSKYLENIANQQEKMQLYQILNEPFSENQVKAVLYTLLKEYNENNAPQQEIDYNGLFQKIIDDIQIREKRKKEKRKFLNIERTQNFLRNSWKYAAILIISFLTGFYIQLTISGNNTKKLSNAICQITAPLGARSEISLPDGSQVTLNAGSKISYTIDYNQTNRLIKLEGEAYFKVAKNKEIPFIVNTKGINIKAVGTEFNVKAYSDEDMVETTVVEGKVEIEKKAKSTKSENIVLNLKSNQKAIFVPEEKKEALQKIIKADSLLSKSIKNIDNTLLVSEKQDVTPVVAWTSGRLLFRGQTLQEIATKLERKYDVQINFENEEAKHFKFSGTLEDETLEQAMVVISLVAPINFIVDKKLVTIHTNKKQAGRYQKYLRTN